MPIEDQMGPEELRRKLRECWKREFAFSDDIASLPEVPSYSTLLLLSRGGFPLFWEHGKQEQIRLFRSEEWSVPYKTEYEIGMGRWKFIRDALRAAQGIEAGTDETPQEARPEGQEPGPKDAPKGTSHD